MIARNYQPWQVPARVYEGSPLAVSAQRSEDGQTLVLQVVNSGAQPASALLRLQGFIPTQPTADIEELAGPLDARNPAEDPTYWSPRMAAWPHGFANGRVRRVFPPQSFTVLKFR